MKNKRKADILSLNAFKNSGKVATRLIAGNMRLNALRTNTLLRKEEWLEYDTRVVEIARQRLVGVEDLRAAGLVKPLSSIGVLISQYEKQSDMTDADVDMSGVARGSKDSVNYTAVSVPVPVIHKDFEVNIRRLAASRRDGDSIDTTQATVASRKVADQLESILFDGVTGTLDGNALYGYTNHPNVNTGTADGDFGTIANIFPTINNMVAAAEADNFYGPFMLYAHTDQAAQMRAVYTDGSGQSAMKRVKENIPQIRDIKVAQSLSAGELVLVQLTEDVVDWVVAEDITMVEWDEQGGMVSQFKVMAVAAPRVKSDADGRCGVVYYTAA